MDNPEQQDQDVPQILWHSNAPHAPTGYGQQTAMFVSRLKADYRPGISAFYGVEATIIPWNGVPIYPALGVTHGNETIKDHARVHFEDGLRGGLTVTLMDVWVLDPVVWRELNVVSWVPVDHDPVPPNTAEFLHGANVIPMAMSEFGKQKLTEEGLDPLYAPHAVETRIYKPVEREEAREALGLPQDAFVVGMVAANKGNPSRKCFYEVMEAFKALHARHKDAVLYLHTRADQVNDGVHLPRLVERLNIDPSAVYFPDQYRMLHYPYSHERMAKAYSAMDVLAAPSMGEGFGIPVIEAQACGTPVIVSDFSAQPELVGAGWKVEGRRMYTAAEAWQFLPDIEDVYEAMVRAYALSEADRKLASDKAVAMASNYDADHVYQTFLLPALQEASARFEAREPVTVEAQQ